MTKEGEQVLKFIKQYRESLSSSISNNENFSYKLFVIPKVGNHQNSSDAAVEFIKVDSNSQEQIDLLNKFVIAIKDKQAPNNNSHPLRPGQIIKLIEEKTGVKKTMHWHTQMYKKYQVRDSKDLCNPSYCNYHIASNIYSYNQAWVDLLIDKEVAL